MRFPKKKKIKHENRIEFSPAPKVPCRLAYRFASSPVISPLEMLLDLSSDLLRSHGNPLARRSTMESRFLVDFAAGGGGDKVDLAITEKRQELLDAGGDGPVVLFMSLWSCPSDNSTVLSFGSQRQQMSEQPRSVGSYGPAHIPVLVRSLDHSLAAEVIFLLAVLCVMSMRLVFRLRSYQVRVSVVFCASKSTVTSARKRVGFNSLAGLTGAMVMREGSGVAPKTWLRV
ncbi:hypothetical protein F2Q70_00036091 [Brassica cretica]|uniref:Uncharacterized protein n=1 Tax=Brassica cretica TaxID=69181 RepID=A0A8S9JXF9_BRACR|nr:hypothetical protein F2Q70_00036091 [Brassica cretica]